MMTKINVYIVFLTLILSGCFNSTVNKDFETAQQFNINKDYRNALVHYVKVIKKEPNTPLALEAAKEAYKIYFYYEQNFEKSLELIKFIIIRLKSKEETIKWQIQLADILSENLSLYERAILEYSKILETKTDSKLKHRLKTNIARSYFALNNFKQAILEIDEVLKLDLSEEDTFKALIFKGNILLTDKKITKAIELFNLIKKDYPELSLKENISKNLVACYEELQNFNKAIEILNEELKKLKEIDPNNPKIEFIALRIEKLTKRKSSLPKGKGR